MKRIMICAVLLMFVSAMLLLVLGSVNNSLAHISGKPKVFRADGPPLPPPPPTFSGSVGGVFVADGPPLPPPPPTYAFIPVGA